MIIDIITNKYSVEEYLQIEEIIERWHMYNYHSLPEGRDIYKEYPDAPYWGEGTCACEGCNRDCLRLDDEQVCEEYEDEAYTEWFNNIIDEEERDTVEDIKQLIKNQIDLFEEDSEWSRLSPSNLSVRLLEWFNESNITYCIIKDLCGDDSYLYVKNFYKTTEYKILFEHSLNDRDVKYAVDEMGWSCYSLFQLIGYRPSLTLCENIEKWMNENKVGIIHKLQTGQYLFEDTVDSMAIKLKWTE